MQELFPLLNRLADESGQIIRKHYRQGFSIDSKADESPVTIADRAVETALREILEKECPEDGILGEETGAKESKSGYTWVIDPIDGTKSFTIGRPSFGTLIALCKDWTPLIGLIDQPILNERWIGDGKTTTFNGEKVTTALCPSLSMARIASTSPAQLAYSIPDEKPAMMLWQKLYHEGRYMVWGGDCYSYGLLANGWVDAVVETMLAPYDFAALAPIVNGAGGWMGDWQGNPLTLKSDGHTLALGDPTLKDKFLKLLESASGF